MKKIKLVSIISAALLALTSCGGSSSTADSSNTKSENTAANTESVEVVEVEKYNIDYTKYDKVVALTFDDGPNTTTTSRVIDKLKEYEIVGSFFVIGNNINEQSSQMMKDAHAIGCEIGNHSTAHAYMNKMTVDEMLEDVNATTKQIEDIVGETPKFFRPPYIAVNDDMFSNIDLPFIAGIGCNDWDASVTAEQRAEKILSQVKDGDIILLHDAEGNLPTVEALDTIIPALLEQGYGFVTVSELFEAKGVEPQKYMVYSNALQTNTY